MNLNTLSSLLIEDLKTVKVAFQQEFDIENQKHYTYKTIEDFEIGDFAVVKVKGILKIVKIASIDEVCDLNHSSNIEYKWIIKKIDLSEYERLIDIEKQFKDKLKKIEQKKLRNKAKIFLSESLGVEDQSYINDEIKQLNKNIKGGS